jgi:flagellar protein FliL
MATTADATAATGADEATTDAPRKSRKKLFIIAGAVIVLCGLGAGGYFMFTGAPAETEHAADSKEPPPIPAVFIDLPPMVVNLVGQPDRPQYLRITVALEVSDEKVKTQIEPLMPRMVDAFQVQLRQMRAVDFEGAAGVYRLKEELLRRINAGIFPARIESVLIKELLLQ